MFVHNEGHSVQGFCQSGQHPFSGN